MPFFEGIVLKLLESLDRPFIREFWSERSACAARGCWHKRRWPLFLIIFPHLLVVVVGGTLLLFTPEGIVVGF